MAKKSVAGKGRLVSAILCVVLITATFTACGGLAENEDVTVVTATTTPTTTAPPVTETTLPELINFNDVNKPDKKGERRSPNVNYFVPCSSNRAPEEFFNDAVFIGDSVTEKLKYYNMANGSFGEAVFLSSSSLSAGNALWDLYSPDAYHPTYQGSKVYIYDGVALSGKKKVFIMLGVNELGWVTAEECVGSMLKVTDAILEKSPDVMFYMQSVTPLLYERGHLTTEIINEYNARLSEVCREKGWYFIDVASVFRDETGHLIEEYCSDSNGMGIHFNDDACKIWVDYLYTHVPEDGTVPVPQTAMFDFNEVKIPEATTAPSETTEETTKETTKETTEETTKKVRPTIVEAVAVEYPDETTKKDD